MRDLKSQVRKVDHIGLLSANSVYSCFGPDFLSESFCRHLVISLVYTGIPKCPFCESPLPARENHYRRFYENKVLNCASCGKQFRSRSNTVLSGMHGKYSDLIFLCILSRLGYDVAGISKFLNVGTDWVRRWARKLRLFEREKPTKKLIVESPGDIINHFVMSCIEKDPKAETSARDLYRCYLLWSEKHISAPAMKQKKFGSIMVKKFKRVKSGTYKYLGVRLIHESTKNQ